MTVEMREGGREGGVEGKGAAKVSSHLHVGGVQRPLRLLHGRVEAKGAVEKKDVVVDGLGDTHHCCLEATCRALIG